MFQPNLLKGKNVLITGGGTGLGKSMGLRFAELGANLIITGRREEVLAATAKEFEAKGAKVFFKPADVRKYDEVEAVFDGAEKALGPIHVLVNNAAGNFISPTELLSPNAFNSASVSASRPTICSTNCRICACNASCAACRSANSFCSATTEASRFACS